MSERERRPVTLSATRVDQEVLYVFSGEIVSMRITEKVCCDRGQLLTLRGTNGSSPRTVLVHAVTPECPISGLFYP